jgi:hypothetical protein
MDEAMTISHRSQMRTQIYLQSGKGQRQVPWSKKKRRQTRPNQTDTSLVKIFIESS